jgi:hypothetical protein
MRRSDLLKLTGLTAPRFGNLVNREQLPFLQPGAARLGWGDYSLDDAVQLGLMLALSERDWPMDRACALVRKHFHILVNERDRKRKQKQDFQFGVVFETLYLPANWSEPEDWIEHGFAGTLLELQDAMSEPEFTEISSVMLVNASATVRRMVHRGRSKGVADNLLDDLKELWQIEVDV